MSTLIETIAPQRASVVPAVPASVIAPLAFVAPHEAAPAVHVGRGAEATRYEGDYVKEPVTIRNARLRDAPFRLDVEGFEQRRRSSRVVDFEDEAEVRAVYYPETEQLIREATGASGVLIFDHTVRKDANASGRRPARHVHVDYTDRSAPQRLRDFLGDAAAERAFAKRYLQVNVWRSINGAVRRSPLAFADARSVRPQDLARTAIHNAGREGEIFGLRPDLAQRWWWYPELDENEAVLIKGFDSRNDVARFTPHTAFDDPTAAADAPARESIELRAFALFD